jgi:hypothetical protein
MFAYDISKETRLISAHEHRRAQVALTVHTHRSRRLDFAQCEAMLANRFIALKAPSFRHAILDRSVLVGGGEVESTAANEARAHRGIIEVLGLKRAQCVPVRTAQTACLVEYFDRIEHAHARNLPHGQGRRKS